MKINKLYVGVGVLCLGALLCFTCGGKKIGYVRQELIVKNASVYQSIQNKQQAYEETWKKEFLKEKEKLVEQDKALSLAKKPSKEAINSLQRQVVDLQEKYKQKAEQIILASQKAVVIANEKVREKIAEFAKKKGYKMLLVDSALAYGADSLDVSENLVEFLNSKNIEINYPDPSTMVNEEL